VSKRKSAKARVVRLLQQGAEHHRAGRWGQAEACYRRILAADARSSTAYHLLGLVAQETSQYQKSIPLLSKALALCPDNPQLLTSLARAHIAQDDFQGARGYLQRRSELAPQSAEAYYELGLAQQRLKDRAGAAAAYKRALALQPDSAPFLFNLALHQLEVAAHRDAVESCRRALALEPDRLEIYTLLGNALTYSYEYAAAAEVYRHVLTRQPDCARALLGLGILLERQGDLAGALVAYQRAAQLTPSTEVTLLVQIGAAYVQMGFWDEGIECYEKVLALEPNHDEARYLLGLVHLTQGNFALGWKEIEHRKKLQDGRSFGRPLPQPQWNGEPLAGARILLHAEQGLGDTMQFVRYVPIVAARGGKVILEVQSRLHRLLASTPGAEVVIRRGDPLPECDRQCSLMSVAMVMGTDMNSIPVGAPYLHADPTEAEEWRERLAGDALRIGIAWAGNPNQPQERRRTVPLAELANLAKLEGTAFYSLQMGPPASELKWLGTRARIVDLQDQQKDFATTAAIVANLDLVISSDTSVVHLAGAMGKPVWVLLHSAADWRWFLDREDSPWYPTARLFRQPQAGDWPAVMARVEQGVRQLVARRTGRGVERTAEVKA